MDKDMQEVLKKAEVLIEALPYIQQFNRKIIVVKYGGSAMSNEELQKNVIKDVTLLKLVGFKPIIVHGGGKEISRWVGKVGKEAKFVNGLRVTDAETMEIAEMVLNKVNKSLVNMVEELGVNAVGLSGKDGGLLKVEKRYSEGQDIGFVGNITEVLLHRSDMTRILIPITSMRMMQPAPLRRPSEPTSWYSSRISRAYIRTSMIRIPLFQESGFPQQMH